MNSAILKVIMKNRTIISHPLNIKKKLQKYYKFFEDKVYKNLLKDKNIIGGKIIGAGGGGFFNGYKKSKKLF